MEYWVDFSASMKIEAENEDNAKEIFYKNYPDCLDFVEIQGIEEI